MSVYDLYLTAYTLVLAGLATAKDLLRDDLREQLAIALAVNHAKFSRNEPMTRTQLDHALISQPLNKAEAHRLAHKLRDLKFYTARTKRAVNSGGVL